jgi:uncharacterized protein (DUF983 family)
VGSRWAVLAAVVLNRLALSIIVATFVLKKGDLMSNGKKDAVPGLLKSVLSNKCPHCRRGHLFTDPNPYHLGNTMKMPDNCPVCGQKLELQTGFYFGTGFVSYGITVFLTFISVAIWWFTIGFSVHDNRIYWWLAVNAVALIFLQPPIQRLARSAWIAIFVRYDSSGAVR